LEQAARFDWPDLDGEKRETRFCLALRDQAAVLVDGTVVPCCLDHEGDIPLGRLPEQSLEEILASPRAAALYHGFSQGKPSEPLCRRCGYATRFG
jgi:radical SAM protein with 4Fe4S-binding SPASM domain